MEMTLYRKGEAYKVLFSPEDENTILQHRWNIIGHRKIPYVRAWINGKNVSMHRYILGMTDPKIPVDHADGNGLNNQRSNIRACTTSENSINRPGVVSGTSKYKGVSASRHPGRWKAKIKVSQKLIYIGSFETEEAAAAAYNFFAKKHFGEFAWLNDVPDIGDCPQRILYPTNTTGFRGVHWSKKDKTWMAGISYQGKSKHIGSFKTPEAAALAYNEAALRYHGDRAKLNIL